jgi:hypothetical protein
MKTYEGMYIHIAPTILDLGTRWRCVVSFKPRPLCLRGNSPRYPLDRRVGGTQSRSGSYGGGKVLSLSRTKPSHTTCNPSLSKLRYPSSLFSLMGGFSTWFPMGGFSTWLYYLFIKIFVYCIITVQIANKVGKKKRKYWKAFRLTSLRIYLFDST